MVVDTLIYQEGYDYHIKDEYFEKVQDSNLIQNKEGGTYRPTFYCLRDNKTSRSFMHKIKTVEASCYPTIKTTIKSNDRQNRKI